MKVRDTSQGRTYAVSSEIGCTAINGAMAVDVPAGGQSVILALDKKLIIDGDDNAKFVEVRWGTNAAIGSRPAPSWIGDVVDGIVSIVGEGKFDLNYIPAENKLYLAFAYDTTEAQIAEVENLLERVLPKDVVLEIDTFPIDYTRVEFLEGTYHQYIDTGIIKNDKFAIKITYQQLQNTRTSLLGYRYTNEGTTYSVQVLAQNHNFVGQIRCVNTVDIVIYPEPENWVPYEKKTLEYTVGERTVLVNGKSVKTGSMGGAPCQINNPLNYSVWLFAINGWTKEGVVKIYDFSLSDIGKPEDCVFIPALDNTGAPCMFDLVSRKPFYNLGTGDFIYPGKETEATTYSLRNRMYAQMTEHGIRRLYRVPEGYDSKEEYAAENGFKLLVETPQPEEGYWEPVWHDREDCIELEWVETEPPVEEELQIEEIENA